MAIYICPQCGADIDLSNSTTCEYCGFTVESVKNSEETATDSSDFLPPFLNVPDSLSSSVDDETGLNQSEVFSSKEPVYTEPDYVESVYTKEPVTQINAPVFEIPEIRQPLAEDSVVSKEQTMPNNSNEDILEETQSLDNKEVTALTEASEIISNVPQQRLEPVQEKIGFHLGHQEEVEEIIEDVASSMQGYQIEEDFIDDEHSDIGPAMLDTVPAQNDQISETEMVSQDERLKTPILSGGISSSVHSPESTVKVCTECGSENPSLAKFCLTCGNKLPEPVVETTSVTIEKNICPDCSFENVPNAKFCMSCGASLVKKDVAPQIEQMVVTQDLVSALNEVEQQVSLQESIEGASQSTKDQPVVKTGEDVVYKVKIMYDNNNKFQYKFVFNKIKQISTAIDDNELKVLMSNSVFVIAVPSAVFTSFKHELEDLDCKVEKIGEESSAHEDEHDDLPKELHYYLSIKGMSSKTPEWKMKFVNMLTLMMPEMPQDEAERIVERDVEKIRMENEHSAKELQKILSKLGCITQIIEMEEVIDAEQESLSEESDIDATGEVTPEDDKLTIENVMMVEASGITPEKSADDETGDEAPRFLILSGVDKKNWVVREKLAERISEIYPNMTSTIAREIVSQVVVRLRVKNLQEAEVLGKEFEEMGWNIRIDEVSTGTGDVRKRSTLTKEELQRRKQTHQSYVKRQKSKHRNLVTAVVVFFVIATLGFFVWKVKFTEQYYVKVKDMDSLELTPTVEGMKVRLRAEPSKKVPFLEEMFLAKTTRFELETKEKILKDGVAWYYVRYPSLRSKKAYVVADIMVRVDKNGNELPPDQQK